MPKKNGKEAEVREEAVAMLQPKGLAISERGIRTGAQFAAFMSAIMADVYAGRVSPGIATAAVNAGGKLLKVVDMQMRYGVKGEGQGKSLLLLNEEAAE